MSRREPTPTESSQAHRDAMAEASRRAWRDPDSRARRLAAMAEARKGIDHDAYVARGKRAASIAIPAWVPACLVGEYREVGALAGEEEAARHCRRLKREMVEPGPFGRLPQDDFS